MTSQKKDKLFAKRERFHQAGMFRIDEFASIDHEGIEAHAT